MRYSKLPITIHPQMRSYSVQLCALFEEVHERELSDQHLE